MRPLSNASSPLVVVLVALATAVEVVVSPITVDAAGSIRNGHNNNNPRGHQQQLLPSGRRRLLHRRNFPSGLACNLFLRDVEYGPNADKPQGYSVDEWFCELSEDDSHRLGVERPYYLDIVDASSIVPSNAIPGQSTLIATEATINFAEMRLYIPTEAKVSVETRTDNTRSRNLMTTKGALDVLMVRITDNKGVAPNADLNQLRSDVFEDEVSLKSQFEACSYGKLQIRPFTGRTETNLQIRNGVVDVSVDYDIRREGDRGELQIAAIRSAEEAIGNLRHQFDAVMFCMPPGTGDWLAYAFVGDNLSFYNNEWCSYVSGQLHEVGHNLGLAHSGEEGEGEYFDQSGSMGLSYAVDDQRICFNPAKNWQLGWYDDKVRTIDPLSIDAKDGLGESGASIFTMNGVTDYKNNNSALIVLRLEQTSLEKDFYIGYNRKAGINEGSVEDGNKMTIVRKESGLPHEFGESMKVAALNPGESHTIENFNGEKDRHVKIRFIGLRNNNATIKVMDLKNSKKSIENEKVPCASHRVELVTDLNPKENRWTIIEDGGIGLVYASSPEFTEKETLYTTKFCLPYDISYKFIIEDKRRDGLCCNMGQGSYRAFDQVNNVIFSGGSEVEFASNGVVEKTFIAVKDASPTPSVAPSRIQTISPSMIPTSVPSTMPSASPSFSPSIYESPAPSELPPRSSPRNSPVISPSNPSGGSRKKQSGIFPTRKPSSVPTRKPSGNSPRKPSGDSTMKSSKNESKKLSKNSSTVSQRKPSTVLQKKPSSNVPTIKPSTNLTRIRTKTTKLKRVRNMQRKKAIKQAISSENLSPINPSPTPQPMTNESKEPKSSIEKCTDSENQFRWDKYSEMLTCEEVSRRKKCNSLNIITKKPLWQSCPKACNRCPLSIRTVPPKKPATELATEWMKPSVDIEPVECTDSKNYFRWNERSEMSTCTQISGKKKCDSLDVITKEPIWQSCPKACKRCSESEILNEEGKSHGSTNSCEDYKKNPLTWGKGQRKLSCQQINKKKKCDIIWFQTNRPLWYICQQSCNKCDEKVPFEDDPFLVDENQIQSTRTSAVEDSFASTQDSFLIAV